MEKLTNEPENINNVKDIICVLEVMKKLDLDLNLWKAQNIYFSIGEKILGKMKEQSQGNDKSPIEWIEQFKKLGNFLNVRID